MSNTATRPSVEPVATALAIGRHGHGRRRAVAQVELGHDRLARRVPHDHMPGLVHREQVAVRQVLHKPDVFRMADQRNSPVEPRRAGVPEGNRVGRAGRGQATAVGAKASPLIISVPERNLAFWEAPSQPNPQMRMFLLSPPEVTRLPSGAQVTASDRAAVPLEDFAGTRLAAIDLPDDNKGPNRGGKALPLGAKASAGTLALSP